MQGVCSIYVFHGFVYPLFNIGSIRYAIGSRPDKLSQILLGSPLVSLKAPV